MLSVKLRHLWNLFLMNHNSISLGLGCRCMRVLLLYPHLCPILCPLLLSCRGVRILQHNLLPFFFLSHISIFIKQFLIYRCTNEIERFSRNAEVYVGCQHTGAIRERYGIGPLTFRSVIRGMAYDLDRSMADT